MLSNLPEVVRVTSGGTQECTSYAAQATSSLLPVMECMSADAKGFRELGLRKLEQPTQIGNVLRFREISPSETEELREGNGMVEIKLFGHRSPLGQRS
jgi:hypothetical protein